MNEIQSVQEFYNSFINKLENLGKTIDNERLKEIKFMLEMGYKLRQQDEFLEKFKSFK